MSYPVGEESQQNVLGEAGRKMSKYRKSQGTRYTLSKRGTPQDCDAKLVIGLSSKGHQKPLDLQKDNCASILDGRETSAGDLGGGGWGGYNSNPGKRQLVRGAPNGGNGRGSGTEEQILETHLNWARRG